MGSRTGTIVRPISERTDSFVSSWPQVPSVPIELRMERQATITTMTRPARSTKPLRRSQVRSITPLTVGMWYGGISITKAEAAPGRAMRLSRRPVTTAARMPMR